jgi:hypothetical protein
LISALKAEAVCFPEIFISTYKIKWLYPAYSRDHKNAIICYLIILLTAWSVLHNDGWIDE